MPKTRDPKTSPGLVNVRLQLPPGYHDRLRTHATREPEKVMALVARRVMMAWIDAADARDAHATVGKTSKKSPVTR